MRAGYGTPDDEVEIEAVRLKALTDSRDRRTLRIVDRIGIAPGAACLEVGAGSGTISRALAERVGAAGRVLSVDKDLRFHQEMPANVEVRGIDLISEELPVGEFDFVHARAVLQHIPERDEVFVRLAAALRPGGHLLIEDSDMRAFAEQPLPEPFGSVHRLLARGTVTPWRDPNFGSRLVDAFSRAELVDIGLDGSSGLMRPNHPSGEWWLLALDRMIPRVVESGGLPEDQAAECRTQMRHPDLVMLGPLMVSVWGRRPVG
ncbi:MAG: methyltransferase domain-containing protein [Acidimicrobiales bacterium]|nr:methyltransferase domain-containing protein [Acidimicrobiales bacterium]